MINFSNIKATLMPNFKGGDGITAAQMFVDDKNKIMRITPYFELNGNRYEFKRTRWLIAEYEKLGREMALSPEDKADAMKANNLMADAKRFAEKEYGENPILLFRRGMLICPKPSRKCLKPMGELTGACALCYRISKQRRPIRG